MQIAGCIPAFYFPLEEKGAWAPFCQLQQVLAKGETYTSNLPESTAIPSEFQSKNPCSPSEFQNATCGMVWIFSGIAQNKF